LVAMDRPVLNSNQLPSALVKLVNVIGCHGPH
jgi:hypothetical protein